MGARLLQTLFRQQLHHPEPDTPLGYDRVTRTDGRPLGFTRYIVLATSDLHDAANLKCERDGPFFRLPVIAPAEIAGPEVPIALQIIHQRLKLEISVLRTFNHDYSQFHPNGSFFWTIARKR